MRRAPVLHPLGAALAVGAASVGLSAGSAWAQSAPSLTLDPTTGPAGARFTATFVVAAARCPKAATFTWETGGANEALGTEPFKAGTTGTCVAVLATKVPAGSNGAHVVVASTSTGAGAPLTDRATFTVAAALSTTSSSTLTTVTTNATTGPTTPETTGPTTPDPRRFKDSTDVWRLASLAAAAAAAVIALTWRRQLLRPAHFVAGPSVLGAYRGLRPLVPSRRRPGLNLPDFFDRHLGGERGADLAESGPAATALREACDDPRRANPLLATLVWQSVASSVGFLELLANAGCSPGSLARRDFVVVAHGRGTRHDLLVLDPGFGRSTPATVRLTPDQVVALATSGRRPDERLDLTDDEIRQAVVEAAAAGSYGVVITSPPSTTPTSCPAPAWPVAADGASRPIASVGVVAHDAGGALVITTALHAVAGRTEITVSGRPAVVVSEDKVTDSCVLRVDGIADTGDLGSAGPLRGLSPRQDERATFDGVPSGHKETRVTAWDLSILANQSLLGSKVYTAPDTVPGDSGAALVDSSGHILGFSVFLTGFDATIGYSAWSWADQVIAAHGLTVGSRRGGV